MRTMAAVMVIAVAALTSCSSTEPAPAPDLPHDMAGKVTADGMYTHLRKLQEIADANRGNRAEGTPGYDASVDYVAKVLKDKGFDVQTPEFDRLERTEGGNPTLTVSGRGYPRRPGFAAGRHSAWRTQCDHAAAAEGARLHRSRLRHRFGEGSDRRRRRHRLLGRRQAEHRGRQGCRRVACRQRARPRRQPGGSVHAGLLPAAHGSGRGDRHRRRRGAASHQRTGAAGAGQQAGDGEDTKRRGADQVRRYEERRAGGCASRQPPRSPGINDNGSGVAALLEAASALGAQPDDHQCRPVRLLGIRGPEGPTKYVRGLARDQFDDIAMYLSVNDRLAERRVLHL